MMAKRRPLSARLVLIALACGVASSGCGDGARGGVAAAPAAGVTYARDVAPILRDNCVPCHHPGGAGPFSLETYADVRRRARQIVKVTRTRYMPPWLPAPNDPEFADVRRLSDTQIGTLAAWVDQGTPAGDLSALAPPPVFHEGWQLGEPDLVLRAPVAWTMPAEGPDVYRNFVFRVPLQTGRFVKGLEILPGNRRVTHHANVLVDRSGWSRARDAEDPDVGFAGMDLQIASDRFDPDSHFLFWKPGTPPSWEPSDMPWRLEPGADLVLNAHLRPSGKPESVQPSLGIYFTDTPPTRFPMLLQLEHDGALDIPAGATDFTVHDELVLPVNVQLAAVYPHAHYLGRQFEARAVRPDGSSVELIRIRDWDPAWQGVFRYAQPVALPAGTRISMRWHYDNSTSNPRNPHTPPVRVHAGDQATDEMGHLWLQVVPARREDQAVLQESVMRHRLEKYPGDFSASANLAAVLQTMGRVEEAIGLYKQAIHARPDVASVHNALGTALQARGEAAEAIAEFAEASRLDPRSTDAHYNWGNALLAMNRPHDALPHFERVLRSLPSDAAALNDYGSALAMAGQWQKAAGALARAVEIAPENGYAHYNLARVLVRLGRFSEALPHYEAAVRLDPGNTDAAEELEALRKELRAKASGD
jgi:Flp pilus assembly protein TadD